MRFIINSKKILKKIVRVLFEKMAKNLKTIEVMLLVVLLPAVLFGSKTCSGIYKPYLAYLLYTDIQR